MAEQIRRSKRQQLVSKKIWDLVLNQLQREEEQYSGMAFSHLPEQEPTIFDSGYEDFPQEPTYSVGSYINNT